MSDLLLHLDVYTATIYEYHQTSTIASELTTYYKTAKSRTQHKHTHFYSQVQPTTIHTRCENPSLFTTLELKENNFIIVGWFLFQFPILNSIVFFSFLHSQTPTHTHARARAHKFLSFFFNPGIFR